MTTPKKKPVNSRRKGAEGERELARQLEKLGFPAKRGQQFKGGADSPDVVCEQLAERGFHLECKRTKDCKMFSPATLAEWDAQALADAGATRAAIICHRWNGGKWWVRVHQVPVGGRTWKPYWQPLEDWLHGLGGTP